MGLGNREDGVWGLGMREDGGWVGEGGLDDEPWIGFIGT